MTYKTWLLKQGGINDLLFKLLIISLPLNLGLHFIFSSAYVGGLLIDYLVPTIFVQDIFAILLCGNFLLDVKTRPKPSLTSFFIYLFLYVLFLSVLLSVRPVPSVYMLLRWLVYSLVSLYIHTHFEFKKDFKFVIQTISYWTIFLGVLAITQFILQGSVFTNYYVLGEQPYSASTPLIDKANVFGNAVIPVYGLFRHPNIFGGYLAITLVLLYYAYRTKYISPMLFWTSHLLGFFALIFTFSYFSWLGYALGVVLLLGENKPLLRKSVTFIIFAIFILSFLIHKIKFPVEMLANPSVYKRMELLETGYKMSASAHYLLGVGLNNATVHIELFTVPTKYIRFVQPTHHALILLLAEAGLLAVVLFCVIFGRALYYAYRYKYFLFVSLMQIILLAGFDHYFFTIQQPFLLLWLLLGLVFV